MKHTPTSTTPKLPFGEGLLNPVRRTDKRHSYLYTNINNLRHFASLDAVVSKDCFQTSIYDDSFGSLIASCVLLTAQELSQNAIDQFRSDVNPVVLEFETEDVLTQAGFGIDLNYEWYQVTDGNRQRLETGLMAFPGYIPMVLVRRIVFRSDEELRDFKAIKFRSMEFDYSKFCVDHALFAGGLRPDIDRIRQIGVDINSQVPPAAKVTVRKRDRFRGSLLAAFGGLGIQFSESFSLDFDNTLLQVISRLSGNSSHSLVEELHSLSEVLALQLRKRGVFAEVNLMEIPKDPTPFTSWMSWDLRREGTEFVDDPMERVCDQIAYEVILERLSNEDSSNFKPIKILETFLERFNETAPHRIPDARLLEFEPLRQRYLKAVEVIKRVVNQKEKASEVLRGYPDGFFSLKAFMTFATVFSPDSFSDLDNRLSKYSLTPFERRLVWSLYGMLNGVGPLGETVKKRLDLLLLTELIVQHNEKNSALPDFTESLAKLVFQRNALDLTNTSTGPDGVLTLIMRSSLGIDLSLRVTDTLESVRLALLRQLSLPDSLERIKQTILSAISVSEKYVVFVTEFSDRDISVESTSRGIRIRHKKPQLESRKVWENWESFKSENLDNRVSFSAQPRDQIDIWKKIARGESVGILETSASKKRKSARGKSKKNT